MSDPSPAPPADGLSPPRVGIVEDNPHTRDAVGLLFESAGITACGYATAEACLAAIGDDAPDCLLLDLCLPGQDGLALQQALRERGHAVPVIFLTGYGEVSTAVRAMNNGAADFIEKPVSDTVLVDKVTALMASHRARRAARRKAEAYATRVQLLTGREREILEALTRGHRTRAIAGALHISTRTVETHRSNIMAKIGVRSIAQVVHIYLATHATGCGEGAG